MAVIIVGKLRLSLFTDELRTHALTHSFAALVSLSRIKLVRSYSDALFQAHWVHYQLDILISPASITRNLVSSSQSKISQL